MILLSLPLVTYPPDDVDDLVALYNATLLDLLNKHAPEREKPVPDRTNSAWIDETVIWAKQARRRAERKKQKTGLVVHMGVRNNRQEIILTKPLSVPKLAISVLHLRKPRLIRGKCSLLSAPLNGQDRSDSLPDTKHQEAAESFSRFFYNIIRVGKASSMGPRRSPTQKNTLTPVFHPRTCSLAFMLSLGIRFLNLFMLQSQPQQP